MERIFIKEAQERLKISRATLYKHIKQLDIKTQKEGKKTYLTASQLASIKDKTGLQDTQNTKGTDSKQKEIIIENLKKELENQKLKTDKERKKNETLILELGNWQGRARTLEELNQKLLTAQTETVQAEIIEDEAPEPTKPRTFAQKWRDFWKD